MFFIVGDQGKNGFPGGKGEIGDVGPPGFPGVSGPPGRTYILYAFIRALLLRSKNMRVNVKN